MYANGTKTCPVRSLKLYIEKRNKANDFFFQKEKRGKGFNPAAEAEWYTIVPLGHNKIASFMPDISKRLYLSQRYTNHSVRATTVSLLAHSGVEAREIMRITGHKSEASLRSYNTDSTDKQKRQYSAIIQHTATDNTPSNELTLTSSITQNNAVSFQHNSVPVFNITNSVV